MKSKLWMLLKIQLPATLGVGNQTEHKKNGKKERVAYHVSGKAGARTIATGAPAKTEAERKKTGYIALMIFVAAMLLVLLVAFFTAMATALKPLGLLYLIPEIAMAAACITSLVTTIYKTNGLLFGFRDYDLVMALPVKTSTVIESRMMILYVMNLFFCMFLMIPSAVIYGMYAAPSPVFYLMFAVCLVMVPLVPLVIATVIGSLIAVAASHFKRKSGMNIILTVVALLAWMAFVMNMDTVVTNFANIGPSIAGVINQIYLPAAWYTQAICEGSLPAFLLFVGVSAAVFAVFVLVVARNFKQLNSAVTANRTTSNYKMEELRQSAPSKALYHKEWKRLTSSSAYLMNTGIGVILLTILSVVMLIFGAQQVAQILGMPEIADGLATVAPVGMGFFMVMTCTSACSVSLEGKSLWIIKSMPVSAKDILAAKLKVNLTLVVAAVAINSTIFSIVLQTTPLQTVLMYVTPLLYGTFTAVFGLKLNLTYPNFDWDSEIKVIKQGMPMMITVFVGIGITIVPAVLAFFWGEVVVYVVTAVLAVFTVALYRNVMTKGVRTFASFQA